jgi:hypothetical protein
MFALVLNLESEEKWKMYGSKVLFTCTIFWFKDKEAVNISDYTASVNRMVSAINRKECRRVIFVL